MMVENASNVTRVFLPRDALQRVIDALTGDGFRCVGPRLKEGVIVYETLTQAAMLPQGVHDRQAPGEYRAVQGRAEAKGSTSAGRFQHPASGDTCASLHGAGGTTPGAAAVQASSPRQFAWANGPQALKPFLFAPREALWRVVRDAEGRLVFREVQPDVKPIAVIGVRACDLAALALQDQHFLGGDYPDPAYARRRENLFIVAVHCSHPAATCFCVSTGDGPRATRGFDMALSELDGGFVAEAGSVRGQVLLDALGCPAAAAEQIAQAEDEIAHAARSQSRRLPGRNLRDVLFANLEHPRWEEVAERCLSCGNCTSVCPTCFCSSSSEQPSLDGGDAEHSREWDSCFTRGHSYIHGVVVRSETRTRYRQWLTHKLGSWHEQYGRSGCVGCGRCVTWCPTGIDITEEATAICGETPP